MIHKSKKIFRKRRYSKTKRNNKKKRLQKGGFSDTNFTRCYEKNLANIQQSLTQYSGKHSIDKINANLFIENQLSEVRKQAARDLIENTIYITLEETFQIIEQLIIMLYGMPEIQTARNIYIYSGNEKKSFYFLSVLALYYIRNHSYKEPIFIRELDTEFFNEIGEDPLIILDDAAYSGSQLSTMVNNIYYNRVIIEKLNIPNIFIALLALNNFSKQRLEKVPTKKNKYGTIEETISPFKLVYLPERLYEPIILKLGLERYFYINYFFSLYTQDTPYISLYFDHKLADDVSTYKKPLLYGPIVPSNYTPTSVIDDTDGGMEEYDIICSELYQNKDLCENLIKKFIDENKSEDTFSKYSKYINISNRRSVISTSIADLLLEKLDRIDICERTIETISFYPFISSCLDNPKLISNIKDNDIINYKYLLFMIPEGCLGKKKSECAVNTAMIPNSVKTADNIEITAKINSIICPDNWYKNGSLKMTCISE
jgi:hypothetical protein